MISSCKENISTTPSIEFKSFPEKDIQFDSNGDIISSEIDTSDFHSSDNCVGCLRTCRRMETFNACLLNAGSCFFQRVEIGTVCSP